MSNETMTSTSSEVATSTWPGGCGTAILPVNGNMYDLEPSGLTIWGDWLYVASDNGKIGRRKLDLSGSWQVHDYGSSDTNDYESITGAKGELMVGVERSGDSNNYPQIRRFDPSDNTTDNIGSFTGSVWNITTPGMGSSSDGMEAMTFVPKGSYPSSWGSANPYYGGLFFVMFQPKPGKIYVYELPQGGGQTQNATYITEFPTQTDLMGSDLCFANNTLYVLFDDTTNALEEMQYNGDDAFETTYVTTPPYDGPEGITVQGSTLYLGYDSNGQQTTDGVYKYTNYTAHTANPCD